MVGNTGYSFIFFIEESVKAICRRFYGGFVFRDRFRFREKTKGF